MSRVDEVECIDGEHDHSTVKDVCRYKSASQRSVYKRKAVNGRTKVHLSADNPSIPPVRELYQAVNGTMRYAFRQRAVKELQLVRRTE